MAEDVVVKITADVNNAVSGINQVKQSMNDVKTAEKGVEDQSKKMTATLKQDYGDINLKLQEKNELLKNQIALGHKNAAATARQIKDLERQKAAIDKQAAAMTKAKGAASKLNSVFGKLGITIGAAFAIQKIISFAKSTIDAYKAQEQAERRLLTAVGNRADVQQRLIAQAKQLQRTTIFGDDETVNAQAMMATLIKEEETLKRLTPLVQDFAAAKGMDLRTAADLVAKAVGSTTNALTRYGIVVEGAVGSDARLESAVNSLTKAFGGQAAALAQTDSGKIQQLSNAWNDLKETIGQGLTSALGDASSRLINLVNGISGGR